MVVFQYGSIVLFNVREHDVDGYLKIVEKHASGLLPEMRKDGEPIYPKCYCQAWYILISFNLESIYPLMSYILFDLNVDTIFQDWC